MPPKFLSLHLQICVCRFVLGVEMLFPVNKWRVQGRELLWEYGSRSTSRSRLHQALWVSSDAAKQRNASIKWESQSLSLGGEEPSISKLNGRIRSDETATSRRNFVGGMAAAAGTMFAPRFALGSMRDKAPNEMLNIATDGAKEVARVVVIATDFGNLDY
jgi:hypothetical protein